MKTDHVGDNPLPDGLDYANLPKADENHDRINEWIEDESFSYPPPGVTGDYGNSLPTTGPRNVIH